jgi:hypothetical protein
VPERLVRWQVFDLDAGFGQHGAFQQPALVLPVLWQLVGCCQHCVVSDVTAEAEGSLDDAWAGLTGNSKQEACKQGAAIIAAAAAVTPAAW